MEIKLQRGIMDERYGEAGRQDSGATGEMVPLQTGISPESRAAWLGRYREWGDQLQRSEVPGLRKMNYEELADRIFDPSSPDLTEAAMVIRYCGKMVRLHEQSLCARCKRAFSRPLNWLAMRL